MPENEGTKNVIVDLVGAVVGPLTDGLVKLYEIETEEDRLLRKTIQTQLEATRWPGFADVVA